MHNSFRNVDTTFQDCYSNGLTGTGKVINSPIPTCVGVGRQAYAVTNAGLADYGAHCGARGHLFPYPWISSSHPYSAAGICTCKLEQHGSGLCGWEQESGYGLTDASSSPTLGCPAYRSTSFCPILPSPVPNSSCAGWTHICYHYLSAALLGWHCFLCQPSAHPMQVVCISPAPLDFVPMCKEAFTATYPAPIPATREALPRWTKQGTDVGSSDHHFEILMFVDWGSNE